ncbi:MAG: NAD(P)-dependent oxidoreductase [bacterium]|nr:NAD(P)-dependent oxidoreductase [bacterium]
MKILVAGGAGYVGSALVPKLLERGYEVDVLDLLWFGNHLPESVRVFRLDVMQADEELLSAYDQVIFIAGISNDPMADYSPTRNFVFNAAAPAYLAYTARKAGVRRFIYASSCSVYGYTVDELCDESAPTVSRYPYGIAKLQGEAACGQLRDENFSVIMLRKGTICGYSPRMRLDLVVNTMFRTALTEGRIVVNNPSIWRPILAIQDAVAAYIRAVEASGDVSGIFNVASGNYTIGELADYVKDAIEERLERSVRLEIRDISDIRNYKVSIDKAVRVLSFKPKHDVADIVEDLILHLSRFEDFGNSLYTNIEVFKKLVPQPAETTMEAAP